MKKFMLFLSLSFFSSQLLADSFYSNLNENVCRDYQVKSNGDVLVCRASDNADAVLKASPSFSKVADTNNIYLWDIIEMGVMPDDSTDHIYSYVHPLLDKNKKLVGFLQVIAARNSEWDGAVVKLINRYDLNGQLVYSKAESI